MKKSEYIIPTKKSPVFIAICNYFGCISLNSLNSYKPYFVSEINMTGETFGIHFSEAVNDLHEWIKDRPDFLKACPKCKFTIVLINGEVNKYKEVKQEIVYTISVAKAKKLLF